MKYTKGKFFLKLFFLVILGIIINFNLTYGRIWHNGSGVGYDDGGEIKSGVNSVIETYIIEGGGYYLNTNSSFQKLLELVELQDLKGVDYAGLEYISNNASTNIQKAVETYDKLIEVAAVTPYNETVINKLLAFDYKGFMNLNDLNAEIFYQVGIYLKKGNITGVFQKTQADLKNIKTMLFEINETISQNKMPDISKFWAINEKISEVSLFGSYVARVFYEL